MCASSGGWLGSIIGDRAHKLTTFPLLPLPPTMMISKFSGREWNGILTLDGGRLVWGWGWAIIMNDFLIIYMGIETSLQRGAYDPREGTAVHNWLFFIKIFIGWTLFLVRPLWLFLGHPSPVASPCLCLGGCQLLLNIFGSKWVSGSGRVGFWCYFSGCGCGCGWCVVWRWTCFQRPGVCVCCVVASVCVTLGTCGPLNQRPRTKKKTSQAEPPEPVIVADMRESWGLRGGGRSEDQAVWGMLSFVSSNSVWCVNIESHWMSWPRERGRERDSSGERAAPESVCVRASICVDDWLTE